MVCAYGLFLRHDFLHGDRMDSYMKPSQTGKASCFDDLSTEHLIFAHTSLIVLLKLSFGVGAIVHVIKH